MELIITPILCLSLFFILELVYFKIAELYNIIDKPNHRSSHSMITLRGGGIIFPLGLLLYPMFYGFEYQYFLTGLILIGFISFMDDINPVSSKVRICFHLVAVSLMFYQLQLFDLPISWIIIAFIFVIGSINAINFMDGINGITGSYAFVTLCTLLFINIYVVEFTSSDLLTTAIISVLVFNYFNFRTKAKCFAGDVGSVSIAFIIIFFTLQLILKTENFTYILLLIVYGLDTVTTILFRIIRKENIGEAHRSHFYQYWANERKIPHLIISMMYALVQLVVNLFVVLLMPSSLFVLCTSLLFCFAIFLVLRFATEGSTKLLGD